MNFSSQGFGISIDIFLCSLFKKKKKERKGNNQNTLAWILEMLTITLSSATN